MRRWLLTLAALGVVSLLGLSSAEAQIQPRGSAPFEPCSMVSSHNHGCVVTRMKGPGFPGELARGSKVGKACAWNLLYLYSSYHLEHHYFPAVPFYHLPALQDELEPFYARHGIEALGYGRLLKAWFLDNHEPHTALPRRAPQRLVDAAKIH